MCVAVTRVCFGAFWGRGFFFCDLSFLEVFFIFLSSFFLGGGKEVTSTWTPTRIPVKGTGLGGAFSNGWFEGPGTMLVLLETESKREKQR